MSKSNGHANGSVELQFTNVSEIGEVYDTVKGAFLSGKTRSLEWRLNQIRQLGYMIQENEGRWAAALAQDIGRPHNEAHLAEIIGMKNDVKEMLSNLKGWMKPKKVKTSLAYMATAPMIYYEPKGTVLILGTWNYPITLLLGPALGALSGGNSMVLKPAEHCKAIANLVTELVPQYLDTSAVKVVNGAVEETQALLKRRWDHIFYTGSGGIGKIIAKAAAEHLTPVTLELGGKSPAVVFDDADIATAGRRIMWGKVVNAGQTCIAPDYVLAPPHLHDKLVKSMKDALAQFYPGGASLLESDQFSKIVSPAQFSRLNKLLEETKGQVVIGGDTDEKRNKISVTVIKGVTEEDSTMANEIFGPILPIVSANSKEDVVKFIEKRDQPLALYVFTGSKKNQDYIRNHTRSGQIMFNDTLLQYVIPGLPFGGTGPSGTGNYHGKHSFQTFTHERASATVAPWMDALLASRYPPYTPGKLKMLKMFTGSSIPGRSKPGGGNVTPKVNPGQGTTKL